MEESSFLTGITGGWPFAQQYRIALTIDNTTNVADLNNFQINITIDNTQVDFWNTIENDGRSILFTDSDESTQLDFWVERFYFAGQTAMIWIEIPLIPASAEKTVYLYFGNTSAVNGSNGPATFIFFDDFEDGDISDWTTYQTGDVSLAADPAPPSGTASSFSLEKINNSDPNGGYTLLGTTLSTAADGYIFSGRIYRPSGYAGGAADRLAVEDSGFNGYGFVTNHSNNLSIERRDGGTGTTIGAQTSDNPPEDSWYKFSFQMVSGGTFNIYYYDIDDTLLWSLTNRTDMSYNSFDRVTVHGGYEYYVDDVRVHKYTDPVPTVSFGTLESKP